MMGDKAGHGLMFTGKVQQEPQHCLGLCDRSTITSRVFLLETKIQNPKSTLCALIYDRSLFMNVKNETLRVWRKICEGAEIYGMSICQVGMRFADTK
jgi:hypothetical protein